MSLIKVSGQIKVTVTRIYALYSKRHSSLLCITCLEIRASKNKCDSKAVEHLLLLYIQLYNLDYGLTSH